MGGFPCCGQTGIVPVVMALDQTEIEQNSERAQCESKNVHLAVGRTGNEKQAKQAKHGHHQPDNEFTSIVFHLHPLLAARAKCCDWDGLTLIHVNAVPRRSGQDSAMLESLHWLGGLCTSDTALQGGMLFGLLVAGAAGSVIHCGPMCGVFVLGQMSERMARLPAERMCEWQRIGNGLLVPYHLGRLTTYAALGAGSASVLGQFAWFGRVSAGLLTVAALLFLSHALGRLLPVTGRIDRAPAIWGQLIRGISRRIVRGSAVGEYLLGVALGFLPCGFLYAAIAAAAAAGRPAMGAAAMVAFGLGTAPVLMVIGVAGYAGGRQWSRGITMAAPALMMLNAALLLVLAWRRLG
jgi:uncharacterized protein